MKDDTLKKPILGLLIILIAFGITATMWRIEVSTLVEIATSEWQKEIMQWLGGLLAIATSLIIPVTASCFNVCGKRAMIGMALSVLLLCIEFVTALSFTGLIQHDYSEQTKSKTIAHKTINQSLQIFNEPMQLAVTDNQADYKRMIVLKNTLTKEDNAVKACGKLTGWKVKTACRNEHGQAFELANNELSVMINAQNVSRETMNAKLKQLNALQLISNQARTENNDIVLMPFAALITDDKQTGKIIQSAVGVLFSLMIVILNASLYWLGGGLIGDFFKSGGSELSPLPRPVSKTHPVIIKRKIDDMSEALGTMATAMYQRKASAESVPVYQRGHSESLINKSDDSNKVGTDKPDEYSNTKMGFITDDNALAPVPVSKTDNVVVVGDLGTHCLRCGVQFPKPRTGKKYCSDKCRLARFKDVKNSN